MSSYQKSVSLDAITVDPRVQRTEGPDQRRVDKMASAFNPDALGVLILSERADGTLVCLDGMHRLLAARQAGHTALSGGQGVHRADLGGGSLTFLVVQRQERS